MSPCYYFIVVINKDLRSCNKVVESVEKEMDEWKVNTHTHTHAHSLLVF